MRDSAAQELILRTVAAHADSLLRTARRFSMCPDDAQDAYQRALEIFMRHIHELDHTQLGGWLHVVVKREAQTIRRSRHKLVTVDEVDLDGYEAPSLPTSDEQLASFDLVARSAEALQRLKPQELRALWLRAQGHSYNDIGALTGWSYTKVNRCLTEGRRSFLKRYANIESGAECERWMPVISAMVDGEATAEQVMELRPHLRNCPGCRATLRALQDSSAPLAAVLPVPLVAAIVDDGGERVAGLLTRIYELVAGGLHDRAAVSFVKAQAVVEATAAGKAAAIAGAAAAIAGGGYATVERSLGSAAADRPAKVQQKVESSAQSAASPGSSPQQPAAVRTAGDTSASATSSRKPKTEFSSATARRSLSRAPEFARTETKSSATSAFTRAAATEPSTPATPSSGATGPTAPEFGGSSSSSSSPEFGP